jgi:hypothetical protein
MATPHNKPVPLFVPLHSSEKKKEKIQPPKTPSKVSSAAKLDPKNLFTVEMILEQQGYLSPKKIGSGSYGDVYSCERYSQKVAVKVIHRNERRKHM